MNEFEKTNTAEKEIAEKTQDIIASIDSLARGSRSYAKDSLFNQGATTLYMQTPEHFRILIDKVEPGYIPEEGRFFQELNVSVHPGAVIDAPFRQIDYNFNEKHDGKFRKRVIMKEEYTVADITEPHSLDDLAVGGMAAHTSAEGVLKSLELEEEVGANNQPVTLVELREIEGILRNSVLLDPYNEYRPVTS
jgi:hypothetical protein